MTITRVQGPARGTSATTTLSVTMAETPIEGNVLVVVIGLGCSVEGTVSSIVQTGVTWAKQISKVNGTQCSVELWLGVIGSGASTSVTITLSATPSYGSIANICEYSDIATDPLDKTATNSGDTEATDTGTTATTTEADELWIGGIGVRNSEQDTPTNGFTLIDGVKYDNFSVAYLEKIVSSTGAANSGTTGTYLTVKWAGCIATFKMAPPVIPISSGSIIPLLQGIGLIDVLKPFKSQFPKFIPRLVI